MSSESPALYLFSPYCLLRPTTNRIFDVRLADSFAGQGMHSEVIYPFVYMKDNILRTQINKFYGVKTDVHAVMQYTPLREHSGTFWRTLVLLTSFTVASFRIVFREMFRSRKAFILSRDVKILLPALVLKRLLPFIFKAKVVYMAPEVKNGKIFKFVIRNADGIIAGTSLSRDRIRSIVPVPECKFVLSLAPVPEYTNDVTKPESRRQISYSDTRPLIVYTGKLGLDVEEVKYILQAAARLPSYNFLFTGGRMSTVEEVRNYCKSIGAENVILTGFLPDSTAIRNYQLAADVLVSYYTSKDHMVEYNYPQKVNEYLSTGNPVITPDFPATRDVLNSSNVLFVKPDDPMALAEGIKKLIEDPVLSARLASAARETIKPLSFPARAKVWRAFLETL